MLKQIEKIFIEVTGVTNIELTEKTRIDKDLNVSSLAKIELICAIEDEFNIDIPNSQIKKLKTVKDLIRFIEKEIG